MLKKLFLPLISVVALSSPLSSTTLTTAAAGAALLAATPAHACSIDDAYFDPETGTFNSGCEIESGIKFPGQIVSCTVDPGTYEMCDLLDEKCNGAKWETLEVATTFEMEYQQCLNHGGIVN